MNQNEHNNKSPRAEEEEKILQFWEEKQIFKKSLEKEAPQGEFVFYEGPPTANGRPGIHHLEARAFKDVMPRYKTMRGFHVGRKGGWDTHGLPVELQVEKELGLKSKKEIEQFGVAEFNKRCKQSVFTYLEDWGKFTKRMGYWVDQENAYFTFNNSYIENLWGVLGKVERDGILYKDYKVVPWCARCGTGLSSHELAQGYEEVKDLSVYVKFKVVGQENTFILAWTTTPWTLPGNVALAINADTIYCKVKNQNLSDEILIIAKDRLVVLGEGYEIAEELKGKDLVGLKYEPLYNFLTEKFKEKDATAFEKAYQVYEADFVTTTDGTGVVHTAVMYGQDDFVLGTKVGLPKMHLVKEDGHFLDDMDFLSDRFVKEKDENGKPTLAVDIIDDLKKRNLFFKQENVKHSYPHCWRCKTPLLYYARDSWYIRMSNLRDVLVAENQKINWEPDYIRDGRFGEWLKEVKDWAISRERYWGTPLPVWETEDRSKRVVIDSLETLKRYTKKSGNKYFVMRHGEAQHNIKNVLSSDEEEVHHLTEKGHNHAKETAEKLKKENINLIFYSPLTRTKETAEVVSGALGKVKMVEEPRLREEGFGILSGKPWSEFEKIYPTFTDRLNKKYDEAETLMDVKKRIGDFIYETEKNFSGQNILIITHDGPAKLLKCVAQGALDTEIEEIYKPGINFLNVGDFINLDFVPLPHDEDYRLDLHKPFIDEIELETPEGEKLKRVKEVMDVWFDSGAMPFAQNVDGLGNNTKIFPADFISEAIDQTRGWFYTLHAVGCLMGKGLAYKNVICLGHLLDKDGKKMSKSLGNVINPYEMIDKYGVDTLRLWMYSVNQPGESKNFDERTVDEINKKVFNLLSNVLSFYELYRDASLESNATPNSNHILDKWIVSKLSSIVSSATNYMDTYKVLEPVRGLRDFIDDLSTWYLRRSRDRLRDGDKEAKGTLYFVLKTISKFLAPFAPFFAESLYQKLRVDGDKESVHLEDWPKAGMFSDSIEEEMKEARGIVTMALEARSRANIKVRQPLKTLIVKKHLPEEYLEIVADEVNVKEVLVDSNIEGEIRLDVLVTEELREEGVLRELARAIQDKRKIAGCSPTDTVSVALGVEGKIFEILQKTGYLDILKKSVLAKNIDIGEIKNDSVSIEDQKVSIEIIKQPTNKRVVIVHGWQGHPGNHWAPWLRKELESRDIKVVEPSMPNKSNFPEDWIGTLRDAVGVSDTNTIIVGHSLGCPTTIGYLMSLMGEEKIAGAVLIGGFFSRLDNKVLRLWDFNPLDVIRAKGHCNKFVSIASDDDTHVPIEKSKELSDLIGGEFILEHNKGHFCKDDGVVELPSALSAILKIFNL